MMNASGDEELAAVASGIAEGVARRLEGIGGLKIRSGARSTWKAESREQQKTLARKLGSTLLLKSSIGKAGDSLVARLSVIDAESGAERSIGMRRFTIDGIADLESRLAADVAGAVFRVSTPENARPQRRAIDPQSYRLTLDGWYQMLNMQSFGVPKGSPTRRQRAAQLFTEAVRIDPLNAHAWAGLSSAWAGQLVTDAVPFDEGYERATAAANRALAIDSTEGSALATLGAANALQQRDVRAGAEFFRKAEAVDPSNPEIFMAKSVILRHARQYDEARDAIRIARELDPLSAYYLDHEANVEFCAGRAEAALRIEEQELSINPTNRLAQAGLTRALAMLDRYDEAIASWRKEAMAAPDSALAAMLASASGRSGYFEVRHELGRKRLASLRNKPGPLPPVQLLRAAFAAGDTVTAFAALQTALDQRVRALYRLSCVDDIDEFRRSPRFEAAMEKIGSIAPQ
jgi:tetratricopeptide (TPR) repeat protein/TolB-like protein